jgi:phosphopentomutase
VIPPGPTVLDAAFDAGIEVVAIGKINDIFGGRGISRSIKASGNDAVIQALDELRSSVPERRQIIFANLNDFDSLYGHRRDAVGFGAALEHFDAALASLLPSTATGEEIMAITADHGCDPGHAGSDHTRETVPLFVAGASWPPACLGTVEGLTAVAGLIAGGFGLQGFNFWSRKTITSVG